MKASERCRILQALFKSFWGSIFVVPFIVNISKGHSTISKKQTGTLPVSCCKMIYYV